MGDLFENFLFGEEAEIDEQFLERGSGALMLFDDGGELFLGADVVRDKNVFQGLIFSVKHGRSPD